MPLRDALQGITILDLTTNLPGPLATQMLGDFGANIIKIESFTGDPVRYYPPFVNDVSQLNLLLNRNKRSLALDLRQKEGLTILHRLVAVADVMIVGFKPSTVIKLGLEFSSLVEINPKLIYCQLTGYGSNDNRAGHDLNYLGEAGILNITGPTEKPVVPGVPIADIGGGSLPTVITVLGALFQRKNEPQYFDISMVDHLFPWLSVVAAEYLAGLGEPERTLHALSGYIPWYSIYQTKDKRFITFAPLESKFWVNFCHAIQRLDLEEKQHDLELCETILPEIFLSRTTDEWNELFVQFDIPGGEVLTIGEAFKRKGSIQTTKLPELGQIQILASPYMNSNIPLTYQNAPKLGEHTAEILTEIGMESDIARLINEKIVKTSE
jgi:crotonobetainyl-CoA:carnitine CoA-transferase CaiB-like acyl-CoA transferase